ncbi:hypothetical protein [Tunicatimonas pelagia]|uniref:hypothetical protein n=1 Tax=Tunicatimonas pelagia TaxID=931531 RepID=UPI002665AE35|nr:hypothetical protein [Tunicatimonas pelagia]WKN40641.1 hypothetical protein P0M28_16505 [Tunicatimonas pelagia]
MVRLYIWGITLFFTVSVSAQPLAVPTYSNLPAVPTPKAKVSSELFTQFVTIQTATNSANVQQQYLTLQRTTQHLNRKLKKSKSTEQFLKYFFYYIHRKHLKKYENYATLGDLLGSGKYDCVSGTALYALLLDALHIQFSVREMTYHMYLEIPLNNGIAIIESTDPLGGFVVGEAAVAKRLAQYQTEEADSTIYPQPIQAKVGMEELLGLSYFNAAVDCYNRYQFTPARQYLRHAIRWYPADRMYAFQAIVEAVAAR